MYQRTKPRVARMGPAAKDSQSDRRKGEDKGGTQQLFEAKDSMHTRSLYIFIWMLFKLQNSAFPKLNTSSYTWKPALTLFSKYSTQKLWELSLISLSLIMSPTPFNNCQERHAINTSVVCFTIKRKFRSIWSKRKAI